MSETYEQRRAKRMAEEHAALDNPAAQLAWRLERQCANEAAEHAEPRRLKRELDPFDWGHWGPF
jgi:hypothetical protein